MDYRFGDYTLHSERYELRRAGVLVKLRPKVFEVLAYLIAHRHRLVSKQELLDQFWPKLSIEEATLHSCIRAARQAVGDGGKTQRIIQTRHGRGFRFVAEIEEHRRGQRESAVPPRPAIPRPLEPPDSPVPNGPVFVPEDQTSAAPEHLEVAGVEAEHKAVTVLCAGLVDTTVQAAQLGPEAMYRLMRTCVATAQRVLQPYGGTLTHVSGEVLVALFGVPRAQEDHARRAILAAVALQQALQEDTAGVRPPLALGVGVHTGPLVVGGLGGEYQRLYTVIGETLDVARELRQRTAPGTILLSATTQQLVQGEVLVDGGETLDGLGRSAPMPVYRVRGVTHRRSGVRGSGGRALSRFVGRERELAMLHERLRHATQGQGQVLGLAGEPGIGKSRLLYEFARSLRARPVTYAEGHCLAYGGATPYLPVQDLLRQLCGITDIDGHEAITSKLHTYLQEVGLAPTAEAPYLLLVLGVAAADLLAQLSPQAIRERTFVSLQQVCLASSRRQTLILAVENLHWSDATSEEWLTSLVERIAGAAIVLLVTYRPGYRPAWLERSYATQLALPRLSADDSLMLVQSVPQAETIPERLQQEIVGKAVGNPFFLEELARAVREHAGEQSTLRIPDTIQAVLAARIDRLPPAAKHLLQVAAVIGSQVSIPVLQAISSVSEHTLADTLRHLQAAELLYETALLPEPVYTFSHALTQEVAYGSLLHERRRVLHARTLETMEQPAAECPAEQVERLALHARRGEVWDRAVAYGEQAGSRAASRGAFRAAAMHYKQAIDALGHLPDTPASRGLAIELHLGLAEDALHRLGEYERELAVLREAEALARARDDRPRLARVLAHIANVFRRVGDQAGALAVGEQALALTTDDGDMALQAATSFALGQIYEAGGDYARAADLFRRTVAARDAGGGRPGGPIHERAWLARALGELGQFREGQRYGEEALRLATREGPRNGLIFTHRVLGRLHLAQGDLVAAIRLLEQGLTLCRAAELWNLQAGFTGDLGYAYALAGRPAEGRALLEEALEENLRLGALHNQSLQVAQLSAVCLLEGRVAEAGQHACQALDLARQIKERGNEVRALYQLGVAQAHADPPDVAQAEAHYRQALALAEELGMRPLQAHCHLGLGTLYAKIGRGELARTELSAAIELYRAMAMMFWLPGAEAMLAGMAGAESRNHG